MKHAGKARRAGLRLITISLIGLLLLFGGGIIAALVGPLIVGAAGALSVLWFGFAVFCLVFFRDPEPNVPVDPKAVVSPAHGKVDLIQESTEPEFMGGSCWRISIFLSVIDVHVQNAPVSGRVAYMKHCEGQFLNAMNSECSRSNENVLYGIEASEAPEYKVAVRLVAGLIARRIVPFIAVNDVVVKGERTSLIQFGSRVDLYLPLTCKVSVKVGDRVKGGETVVAMRG